MVLKPKAHTVLSLLLKFFTDLCSSGCLTKGKKTEHAYSSGCSVSSPSCNDVDKDAKMNVLYWCVAFVALLDSLSDLWKSAVSNYGLFTSQVRVSHYREG